MFLSCFILGIFGYDKINPEKRKEPASSHVQQATPIALNITGQGKSSCEIADSILPGINNKPVI